MIVATQLRPGNVIKHKDELCKIVRVDHVTPGNWRGMVHAKMVNLLKGNQVEFRFRSEDRVEQVRLETKQMEFLYQDGDGFIFMDTSTYDQVTFTEEIVGDAVQFLVPNTKCDVSFYETTPISVVLPQVVELKVTETEPRLRGATVSASMKPATLETGAVVQVPQFVEIGETLRIDTVEGKYLERAK